MDIPSAIATNLPRALKALRAGIRRDRANAYALLEPWTLPPLGGDLPALGLMPPAPFEDARIRVEFSTQRHGDTEPCASESLCFITVLPWELDSRECDGCTLAPDTWGDLKLYVGALFHDRWYLSMESIAEAWGWPVARVRRLGDIVFASVLRDQARGLPGLSRVRGLVAARLYYAAARAFGGAAHRIMAALLLSLALSGCAGGCAAPEAWDGETPADAPAHSFTNALTGAHFERNSQPAMEEAESGVPSAPAGGDPSGGAPEPGQEGEP